MKSKYILSIFIVGISLSVLCQNTVETPYGTSVVVWTQGEMGDAEDRHNNDDLYDDYIDSGAVFHPTLPGGDNPYPSSTNKFNCHGYAWHMSWMGPAAEFDDPWNMTDLEAANYFNDPSFKSFLKADADIWLINGGTHSALATSNTDELKSKWGTGPLATHGIGDFDSPYPITSVTYYKECYKEIVGSYSSDIDVELCKAKYSSLQISSNVDVDIVYEDWVLIEDTFTIGAGATIYIYPD